MSLTLRPTGLALGGVELPGIVAAATDHDGEPHAGRNAPNTRRIIAADGLFAQSPPSTTCKLRRSYFDNDAIRVRSASTDGEISRRVSIRLREEVEAQRASPKLGIS